MSAPLPEGVSHLLAADDAVPSAAPPPVAPDPSAQAAQDDGSEGYFVGECGHRVPGGPAWHVGPCDDCEANAT